GLKSGGWSPPASTRPVVGVDQRLAFPPVALFPWLPKKVVDAGVPAVGVGSVADNERLQACRSVTLRRGSRQDEALPFLRAPALEERRSFHSTHSCADPHHRQRVGHGFGKGRELDRGT